MTNEEYGVTPEQEEEILRLFMRVVDGLKQFDFRTRGIQGDASIPKKENND